MNFGFEEAVYANRGFEEAVYANRGFEEAVYAKRPSRSSCVRCFRYPVCDPETYLRECIIKWL